MDQGQASSSKHTATNDPAHSSDDRAHLSDKLTRLFSPDAKELHDTRMKELTETNSAAAKELDFLGKKLVEKRDLFFIDEKIYHEYYQDLQGMKASFKADPSLDFEDWIEDLTEQLEESKAELEADRKVIMELERKYRDIFLGP